MHRSIRSAGCALAILFLSLSAFAPAMAQSPPNKYGFCHGLAGQPRVNNYTRLFVLGPSSPPGALSGFYRFLYEKHDGAITQEKICRMFATAAEARAEYQKSMVEFEQAAGRWPPVEVAWLPEGGATLSGAMSAQSPATTNAPKPAATAAATPKPAPAVVMAKPTSPARVKPAPAASKPAVYVICRSERNTDLRRFYNPPVDGRGAGYPEWMAAYGQYLASRHNFKGSNYSCGKYPTREAAQTDYDSWVTSARAQPTINGRNSPIIITDWKY